MEARRQLGIAREAGRWRGPRGRRGIASTSVASRGRWKRGAHIIRLGVGGGALHPSRVVNHNRGAGGVFRTIPSKVLSMEEVAEVRAALSPCAALSAPGGSASRPEVCGLWKMETAMLKAWKQESGCMYRTHQWPSGLLYAWKTHWPPSRPVALIHRSTIPPGATLAALTLRALPTAL